MKIIKINQLARSSKLRSLSLLILVLMFFLSPLSVSADSSTSLVNPQSSSVGLTGTINSPPPSVAATITVPSNGQVFTNLPITISGICQTNLLIKIYDNGVFIGSANCTNSSYSITASLFNGSNALVAEDFDNLDQQGPNSSTVTVTFNNPNGNSTTGITITSPIAKLGANPGSTLTWPIDISGGQGPYAISIDWGDGSAPELLSHQSAGVLYISHIYKSAGIYSILIKITDAAGNISYLQLVGVANGKAGQSTSTSLNNTSSGSSSKGIKLTDTTLYIIILLLIIIPLITFWLGSRHRLSEIKKKLQRGENLS
jgi:hypothetical protein